MQVTIYHNPRCTKSRQTLARIHEKGVEPTVIEYLKEPPDAATLRRLVKQLGIPPEELVRPKEHKALGLPQPENDDQWIERMAAHPQIIERPIVVVGQKAVLGRPPENVDELLPG